MARITVIPDDSWDGALVKLYPRVIDRTYGRVDNILDIVEVVGYYAYANRIADGLGIQTEHWIPD